MRVLVLFVLMLQHATAGLTRLEVERTEAILDGKAFGLAGAYQKLVGKAHFALDPNLAANAAIVDLKLAPRNAQGLVECSANFYLITPVDRARGNGKLFYEVGNRGGKAALRVLQKAVPADDPTLPEHFGDGSLMRQGYSILWMGWQWDVPQGRMRAYLPLVPNVTGLVRGNFIFAKRTPIAELADRGHIAYAPVSMDSPEDFMTIRDTATGKPQRLPRGDWRMLEGGKVSLNGGFAPGQIYDVVYRASGPPVLGCTLAATRDMVAHFKTTRGIKTAYAWGVSQSGRFLRQFLYEGFNEMEQGGMAFDGVIDEVGGAGRGSFNLRFGQASRDAEQHFNFFYPVDIFPFTDAMATDPFSRQSDSLLTQASARGVVPKLFHILSSSEYYNRGASLIHTDPEGKKDIAPPETSRIYMVSSGSHFAGAFPPKREPETLSALNPLHRVAVTRALFAAMDRWVSEKVLPPPSQYPKLIDKTLLSPESVSWPRIPNLVLPPPNLKVYLLAFSTEPPKIGPRYSTLVPAVDADGNDIAGIRLPLIAVPLATYTGWNYRHPESGAATQLAGETGSILPFSKTRATRNIQTDTRLSVGERYPTREHFLGLIVDSARVLMQLGFLLAEDLPDTIDQAAAHYQWTMGR